MVGVLAFGYTVFDVISLFGARLNTQRVPQTDEILLLNTVTSLSPPEIEAKRMKYAKEV